MSERSKVTGKLCERYWDMIADYYNGKNTREIETLRSTGKCKLHTITDDKGDGPLFTYFDTRWCLEIECLKRTDPNIVYKNEQ